MSQTTLSKNARIRSAGAFIAICSGLFLFVVGVTVLCMTLFGADATTERQLVAEFSGTDDGETGSFRVDELWEFRWEHSGRLKRITWTRDDGAEDMFLEMPGKPIRYEGGINYDEPGTYHFKVEGTGDWSLKVYQF